MSEFSGIKVLVVEDEGLIAMMIEDMLLELGCQVVASVAELNEARRVAATVQIDLAVLDVNLGGERSFPIARILRERNLPFLFSTGYGADGFPSEFSEYAVLNKPFSAEALKQTIVLALAASHRA